MEEQQNQQSPPPVTFAFSVKLDTTAKGAVVPTVHVYSNDVEQVRTLAVQLYVKTIADLKAAGLKPATEGGA